MESTTSCVCDSPDTNSDPTEYLEKLKRKYVDRTAKLQAQQQELERKILKMESFIGNKNRLELHSESTQPCLCDTGGIPRVFPETPVRDIPKPTINTDVIQNQKIVTQQCSFFQKMMENARNMLSLKCACPNSTTTAPTDGTQSTTKCMCDDLSSTLPQSTSESAVDRSFRKCTCPSPSTSPKSTSNVQDRSIPKCTCPSTLTSPQFTDESAQNTQFRKCTCPSTLSSPSEFTKVTTSIGPVKEQDRSLQEKVVDYDASLTDKSSNCSCDLSEPSTLQEVSCSCNLIDSRVAQQQTSMNASTSVTGKKTGTDVDAATTTSKTGKASGRISFSSELISEECSCEECACDSSFEESQPEMKDAATDNAVKAKGSLNKETSDDPCTCPLRLAEIHLKPPESSKQLSSNEPARDATSKSCTCCKNVNCPLRPNALSSAGIQVVSETKNKSVNIEMPKPGLSVGVLCCSLPSCPSAKGLICKQSQQGNQCALVGSPLLNEKDFGDAAVQNKVSTHSRSVSASKVPCDCNTPQGPKKICDLSGISLTSNDISEMQNIAELAKREKQMKRQIQALQKRERQYQEVSKGVESLKSVNPCCCCQAKSAGSEIEKIGKELRLENQILKHELEDMKVELRHCIEKVEGPMKLKLQVEKQKCECLQMDLKDASKNMIMNKTTYEKEMNQLKLQLCCACTNISELNEMNQRLQNEMNQLDCLCQKLEDDLIKQKVDEAETIKRITGRKFGVDRAPSEDSKCESNLDVIARKLSKTIKELAPCDECSKLPPELAGAARCIKDLTDMVRKRKVKSSAMSVGDGGCNCGKSRSPSRLPSRASSGDCGCTCCGPQEGEGEGRKDIKTLLPPDVKKGASSKFNVDGKQSSYYSAQGEMNYPCSDIGHPCGKNKGTGTREDTIDEEAPVKEGIYPCSNIGHPCKPGKSQAPPIQVPSRLNQECHAPCSEILEPVRDGQGSGDGDAESSDKSEEEEPATDHDSDDVKAKEECKKPEIQKERPKGDISKDVKEDAKKEKKKEKERKVEKEKTEEKIREKVQKGPVKEIVQDEIAEAVVDIEEPTTHSLTDGDITTPSTSGPKSVLTSDERESTTKSHTEGTATVSTLPGKTSKMSRCPWKVSHPDLPGVCSCETCICSLKSKEALEITGSVSISVMEPSQSAVDTYKKNISDLPKDDIGTESRVQFAKTPGEIPFEEKRWGPEFPYDVQNKAYEILGELPQDLHMTTTVTQSGTLEVYTEGPVGMIVTTMTYTDDGNIEVETQMGEQPERERPTADGMEKFTSKPPPGQQPIAAASSLMSGPSGPEAESPYSDTSGLTSNIGSTSSGVKPQATVSPELTSGAYPSSESGAAAKGSELGSFFHPEGPTQVVPSTARPVADSESSASGIVRKHSEEEHRVHDLSGAVSDTPSGFKEDLAKAKLSELKPAQPQEIAEAVSTGAPHSQMGPDSFIQSSEKKSEGRIPLSDLEGGTSTIGQLPSGEVFTPDQVVSDFGMDQGDQGPHPVGQVAASVPIGESTHVATTPDEDAKPVAKVSPYAEAEKSVESVKASKTVKLADTPEVSEAPEYTVGVGATSSTVRDTTRKETPSELTGGVFHSEDASTPVSVPTGTICDRSCQSKNQTDQSCQCCECKTIGVSTSGDKETITETDEAMGKNILDDHIEGTKTDTDSEFITISDKSDHALAQTSSIRKPGDTTEDITTPVTVDESKVPSEVRGKESDLKVKSKASAAEVAEITDLLEKEVEEKLSSRESEILSQKPADLAEQALDKEPSDISSKISEQVQKEIVYEAKDEVAQVKSAEPLEKGASEPDLIEVNDSLLLKHPELLGKTPAEQQAILKSLGYKARPPTSEEVPINDELLQKHPELVGKTLSQQQAILKSLGYKARSPSFEEVPVDDELLQKHPELVGKTPSQHQAILKSLGYKARPPISSEEVPISDELLQKHPELVGKTPSQQQAILKSLGYKPSKAASYQEKLSTTTPSSLIEVDKAMLEKHPELAGLSPEEQQRRLKELDYKIQPSQDILDKYPDFAEKTPEEQQEIIQAHESALSMKQQLQESADKLLSTGVISEDLIRSHPELAGKSLEEQKSMLKELGFDLPGDEGKKTMQSLAHIPISKELLDEYPDLAGKTSKEQQEYLESVGIKASALAVSKEILSKHPSLIGKPLDEQVQFLLDMGYILDEVLERVDQRVSEDHEPEKKRPCKAPCGKPPKAPTDSTYFTPQTSAKEVCRGPCSSSTKVPVESTYFTPQVSSKELKACKAPCGKLAKTLAESTNLPTRTSFKDVCKAPCSGKPSRTSPKPSANQISSLTEPSESKSSASKFTTPQPSSRDVSICCKVCCRTTATDSIPTSAKPSVDQQASCRSICRGSCRSAATINTPSVSKRDCCVAGDTSTASGISKSRSVSLQQRPSSRDDSTYCRASCRSISLQSSKTKQKEVRELVPARSDSTTTSSSSDGRLRADKKHKEQNPVGEVPSIVSELSDKERPHVESTKRPRSDRKKRRKMYDTLKGSKCNCQGVCTCRVCSPHRSKDSRTKMSRAVRSCDCPPGNMVMIPSMMVMSPMHMSYSMPPTGHATNCRCNACVFNDPAPPVPPRQEVSTRPHGESVELQTESPTSDENDRRGKKLATHPPSCECIDCLCMPKVKELARTREYPVVHDRKQVYHLKVKCDTCTNAKTARRYLEQRSRIPVATSRLTAGGRPNAGASQAPAGPTGSPGPAVPAASPTGIPPCDCAVCECTECPDENMKKSGGTKEAPASKEDDVQCTCDVCSCPRSDLIKGDGALGQAKVSPGKLPEPISESAPGVGGDGEACTCAACVCCGSCIKSEGTPKKPTAEAKPPAEEKPPSPTGDAKPAGTASSDADHPPGCSCKECNCPAIEAYRGYPHDGSSKPSEPPTSGTPAPSPDSSSKPPVGEDGEEEEECTCGECDCPGKDTMPDKTPDSGDKPPPSESSGAKPIPEEAETGSGGPPPIGEPCNCDECVCSNRSAALKQTAEASASPPGQEAQPGPKEAPPAEQPPPAGPTGGAGVPPTTPVQPPSAQGDIPPCDCSPCKCEPCADPNVSGGEACTCQPCECLLDEALAASLMGHLEDCDCPECTCPIVDTGTSPEPPLALPPKDEHPADCDCDLCQCYDEILQDQSMQTAPPPAPPDGGDGKPGAAVAQKPSTKDGSTHVLGCACPKCICPSEIVCVAPPESTVCMCGPNCLCIDCIMMQSEKELKVIPPTGYSAKPSAVSHDKGPNCICRNCICIDCKGASGAAGASANEAKPSEGAPSGASPEDHGEGCTCTECRCDICSRRPAGEGAGQSGKPEAKLGEAADKPASGDHPAGCQCTTCTCKDCGPLNVEEYHPDSCQCPICRCDVCAGKPGVDSAGKTPGGEIPGKKPDGDKIGSQAAALSGDTPICTCEVCECGPSHPPPIEPAKPSQDPHEPHPATCTCPVCTCLPSGEPIGASPIGGPPIGARPVGESSVGAPKVGAAATAKPADPKGVAGLLDPPPFELPKRIDCNCDTKNKCTCVICSDRRKKEGGAFTGDSWVPEDYVAPPFEVPVRINCICTRCSCPFCQKDAPQHREVAAQPSIKIKIAQPGVDVAAQKSTNLQKTDSTHHTKCTCEKCNCSTDKITKPADTLRSLKVDTPKPSDIHGSPSKPEGQCTCQKCYCDPCKFKGPQKHFPGCTCEKCWCAPCKFDAQGASAAPGPSEHVAGCECAKCACSPCKFKEEAGIKVPPKPSSSSPPTASSGKAGTSGPAQHAFDCECQKCACSPCKFKEEVGIKAPPAQQPSSLPPPSSGKAGDSGPAQHAYDCECEKCACSPCKFKEEAGIRASPPTSPSSPPPPTPSSTPIKAKAGGGNESIRSVHVEGQLHCICPTCTCGEDEVNTTNLDVSGKFSKPPSEAPSKSQGAASEIEKKSQATSFQVGQKSQGARSQIEQKSQGAVSQVEQSADTLILPTPNVQEMFPPKAFESAGQFLDVAGEKSGKPSVRTMGEPSAIKRMDEATLVQSLQKANQESCECKEQIEEIKKTLEKIRCACSEAEYHSTHNVGQTMGKDMRQSSARPFIKQASAFGQTMSGLKMALNNLQSKCKAKDKMIEAMTTELAQRGTPEVFDKVLDMSCKIPHALDYDQADDVKSLDKLEHQKLAVLYAPTQKRDMCTCAEDLRKTASKGVEVRTHKHKKKEKKSKKSYAVEDCECSQPQIIQREEKDCQMITLAGFEVIDIRRITEDSLIVKWNAPKNSDVQGYDIYVNGSVASKVMSGTRTSAMMHSLDLSKSIQITIYAVTKCGRIEPPAIAIYEIKN